jgi:hypothetical protein
MADYEPDVGVANCSDYFCNGGWFAYRSQSAGGFSARLVKCKR